MDKLLTRDEQRKRAANAKMMSVRLEFTLRGLIRQIRAGSVSKLSEFQQYLQYAPESMRLNLLRFLEEK